MNPIKEQLSQLVQDVIDGNESAIEAKKILDDIFNHVIKCRKEISEYVDAEWK